MPNRLDLDELWEREQERRRGPDGSSLLATAIMFLGLAAVLAAAFLLAGCEFEPELDQVDAGVDARLAEAAEPELPTACIVAEPGDCEVPQTGGVGEDRPGNQQQPE